VNGPIYHQNLLTQIVKEQCWISR